MGFSGVFGVWKNIQKDYLPKLTFQGKLAQLYFDDSMYKSF